MNKTKFKKTNDILQVKQIHMFLNSRYPFCLQNLCVAPNTVQLYHSQLWQILTAWIIKIQDLGKERPLITLKKYEIAFLYFILMTGIYSSKVPQSDTWDTRVLSVEMLGSYRGGSWPFAFWDFCLLTPHRYHDGLLLFLLLILPQLKQTNKWTSR